MNARLIDPYEDSLTISGVITRPPRDEDTVRRDARGRPYIKEIDILGNLTGREVTYTRVTKYIDCIDDKSMLARWGERQLVKGLLGGRGARWRAEASSLLTDDKKSALNDLIWKIKESAGAEDQAAIGTAVHAITERYDLGWDLGEIDNLYQDDLTAYIQATKYLVHHEIERLMVNDDLRTAGTPDRITEYRPCRICGRTFYIFDLKTGRVDGYTQNSQAMQLAVYAHSKIYETAGHRYMPVDLCLHKGIICSLPAGSGRAELQWIDIEKGWELVQIATQVRKARNTRVRRGSFSAIPNISLMLSRIEGPNAVHEVDSLRAKYAKFWTPKHEEAAKRITGYNQ